MARDWRKEAEKCEEPLRVGEWYRTKLSDHDHILGRAKEFVEDNTAWCGLALDYIRDWGDEELGGLWYSNRTSNRCATCNRREKAYLGIE